MGVLYDYFRAPGPAEVREHLDENDGESPVPSAFDGIELKSIDPTVLLGRLVGLATDREWSPDLAHDQLIWPAGAEQDMAYEGPWVTVLPDSARDVLAGIPADRIPGLADSWATAEEFGPFSDPEFLREVIAEFTTLAAQARTHGESLYCWMSL
ncbi:hypothetical protein [Paractinoplanes toevensis]|uniref:DUF1877 family protein n=1 Tax=Paractinoplanes toevensis TaxID=571911 RepID=A0A919W9N2_9ACTN|nr:hypothetical protein [Actinoplanes toevensis]GIM96140.1 hypothetical protein Ato02nite_079330 [Actinoplanes toevensis]